MAPPGGSGNRAIEFCQSGARAPAVRLRTTGTSPGIAAASRSPEPGARSRDREPNRTRPPWADPEAYLRYAIVGIDPSPRTWVTSPPAQYAVHMAGTGAYGAASDRASTYVCTAQAGSGGMASGARDRPHRPGTATLKFRKATLNPRPAKEVGAPAGHPPLPAAGLAQPSPLRGTSPGPRWGPGGKASLPHTAGRSPWH